MTGGLMRNFTLRTSAVLSALCARRRYISRILRFRTDDAPARGRQYYNMLRSLSLPHLG